MTLYVGLNLVLGCSIVHSLTRVLLSTTNQNEINEALGANYATPDDLDEADLDAELEMLGDELEEELAEEAEADATPSYLLPATPNMPAPGETQPANAVDEFGLPSAPIKN